MLASFPPGGVFSRLRACVVKYVGLRLVVEAKNDNDPGKACVYVGVGVGPAEQLLLASVSPVVHAGNSLPSYMTHDMIAVLPYRF